MPTDNPPTVPHFPGVIVAGYPEPAGAAKTRFSVGRDRCECLALTRRAALRYHDFYFAVAGGQTDMYAPRLKRALTCLKLVMVPQEVR